ncbi:hypothetical protein [Rhizobium sp. P007]|uniref:hypothetical protein n=1 Tax=Rhizobium sp. P007 TaxID=285908 RepID=UPI00115C2979|nr:hypothetical protein [Rhizobium sp. P007]CAD7041198.1 hypothetical protein RP007_00720 [Rhizobium sp. P007]
MIEIIENLGYEIVDIYSKHKAEEYFKSQGTKGTVYIFDTNPPMNLTDRYRLEKEYEDFAVAPKDNWIGQHFRTNGYYGLIIKNPKPEDEFWLAMHIGPSEL